MTHAFTKSRYTVQYRYTITFNNENNNNMYYLIMNNISYLIDLMLNYIFEYSFQCQYIKLLHRPEANAIKVAVTCDRL